MSPDPISADEGDPADVKAVTAEEIQDWMVAYLAKSLEIAPDTIDTTIPFEALALDSMTAISMTGDLEQWLGRSVDPTVVYDYPTIEEFAEYLAQER
jgi:acyl carrier protein